MIGERGFEIDHATLNPWVLHFAPLLVEKRSRKYKRPVHGSWRMDETYIKIKGNWGYLYRAVDKYGKTVDFMVSKRRDAAAAKAFFRKASIANGLPHRVNIEKAALKNPLWIAGIGLTNTIKKNQLTFTKYIDKNLTPAQQFYRLASA